jgi:hypothetical protein
VSHLRSALPTRLRLPLSCTMPQCPWGMSLTRVPAGLCAPQRIDDNGTRVLPGLSAVAWSLAPRGAALKPGYNRALLGSLDSWTA